MLKQQRLFNANWGLLFAYYGAHAADLLFAPTIIIHKKVKLVKQC
jgi:hypothetical protein